MKKLVLLLLIGLLMIAGVSATYWCGDGFCEAEYCPGDCTTFLSTYCDDRIEVWECDEYCGTTLGWIRPFECGEYGYTPTEDCITDCPPSECVGTCIDDSSRVGPDDYCRGLGYIDEGDCPDCPAGEECIDMIEDECIDTYGLLSECPECDTCPGYEKCDSCCTGNGDCPFQWWLLIIGGIIGYFIAKNKKGRKWF